MDKWEILLCWSFVYHFTMLLNANSAWGIHIYHFFSFCPTNVFISLGFPKTYLPLLSAHQIVGGMCYWNSTLSQISPRVFSKNEIRIYCLCQILLIWAHRHTMQSNYLFEKYLACMYCMICFLTWQKVGYFWKPVYYHKNRVKSWFCFG